MKFWGCMNYTFFVVNPNPIESFFETNRDFQGAVVAFFDTKS